MAAPYHAYPYFDRRFHLSDSQLTEAARAEITNVHGPIVEIGGPTERGYRLLGDVAILPSKPIITNVAGFFGTSAENVDRLVDGKAMPFADSSIGMFLASHIGRADYFEREVIARTTPVETQNTWAQLADEEYIICLSDKMYRPKYNLRIGVLKEMTRTLVAGGLILFEAIEQRDIEIARMLGNSMLSQTVAMRGDAYDCVFKKSEYPLDM